MFAPKSILVPTDFSQCSDHALSQAADIAEQFDAKLYLLHVVTWPQELAAYSMELRGESIQHVIDGSVETIREKMQNEVRQVLRARNVDITFDVKIGVPYKVILADQEERKADLIVMGSHGQEGIIRSLLGSVARHIVHLADCSVLVVK